MNAWQPIKTAPRGAAPLTVAKQSGWGGFPWPVRAYMSLTNPFKFTERRDMGEWGKLPAYEPAKRLEPREVPVTVCVAAIGDGVIVGASDRMLSTSEIAFEPPTRKVWSLTSAIYAMTAGDAAVTTEVLSAVQADINAHIAADGGWLAVSAVVDLYIDHWQALRRRRAERLFLAPLGLTISEFLDRQQTLDANVADKLTNALIGHSPPATECIIAGIDSAGPHIWVTEDGSARCEDTVGFAAIGAGGRHANSQMMIGLHNPYRRPTETVVLVHMAKKRAEVAPSVGIDTDMFLLGPELGQRAFVPGGHIDRLDQEYFALRRAEGIALEQAKTEFDTFVGTLLAQSAEPQEIEDGQEQP